MAGMARVYDNMTKDVLKAMSHFSAFQEQFRAMTDTRPCSGIFCYGFVFGFSG